jgi:hypothetical protein
LNANKVKPITRVVPTKAGQFVPSFSRSIVVGCNVERKSGKRRKEEWKKGVKGSKPKGF